MSLAWMAPVPVWVEPTRASAVRIGYRVAIAVVWAVAAVAVPWWPLSILLSLFSVVALAHAALAVANLRRNKGVLLRLMGTGTLEWPRSLQEEWLKKGVDWVDGPVIEVVEIPSPQVTFPTGPHVNLVGSSATISRFPLHGASVSTFVAHVNALVSERGVTFVPEGSTGKKPVRKGEPTPGE